MNTNINGTHYMLAALRELRPACALFRWFVGDVRPSSEDASVRNKPIHPRSPYGIRKVAGFELTRIARELWPLPVRNPRAIGFLPGRSAADPAGGAEFF